jgi:hypothetical protein
MLKIPLCISVEKAEEKLKAMKKAIGDRVATASEVNEFNKLENYVYKEKTFLKNIEAKKLDNSILKLTVKIEGKEVQMWTDWQYFNAELEFRKLANECMWNQVDFQNILKCIKAEGITIEDFNKLNNEERNKIIDKHE